MCKSHGNLYYHTPELNDILYLNCKGFRELKNFDLFPGLKCLYFQTNGCKNMLGLEKNTKLMTLYLQENCISKIEGLNNHPMLG